MKECHLCPFNADVQAGKFKHLPFEQTPCHGCPGNPVTAGGPAQRALRGRAGLVQWSLEEMANESIELGEQSARLHEPTSEIPIEMQLALHVIQTLFDLSSIDREILLNRLTGLETMKEHAARLNITCQASYNRLRKMRERYPWIAELIEFRKYSMNTRKNEKGTP